MSQLVPFYFVNQVVFAFLVLIVLIYAFSKYILPRFERTKFIFNSVSKNIKI